MRIGIFQTAERHFADPVRTSRGRLPVIWTVLDHRTSNLIGYVEWQISVGSFEDATPLTNGDRGRTGLKASVFIFTDNRLFRADGIFHAPAAAKYVI
ncbi:MAG TPA: hypothetical protein VEP66_02930 [Myxococcales bacterium]|nr:hypothetical protein [Myxococcales bacterium]